MIRWLARRAMRRVEITRLRTLAQWDRQHEAARRLACLEACYRRSVRAAIAGVRKPTHLTTVPHA